MIPWTRLRPASSAPCDPLWECHGAPQETCDHATSSQPCLVDGSVSDWAPRTGERSAVWLKACQLTTLLAPGLIDPLHAPRDPGEVFGASATSVAPLSYSEHSPCFTTDGGLLGHSGVPSWHIAPGTRRHTLNRDTKLGVKNCGKRST